MFHPVMNVSLSTEPIHFFGVVLCQKSVSQLYILTKIVEHKKMTGHSPYAVLNVATDATMELIKKQYIIMAQRYHPDRQDSTTSEETMEQVKNQFIKIQEAWELLRDAKRKRQYDREYHLNKYNIEKQLIGNISDFILLSEMAYDEELDSCSSSCRCGGSYVIQMETIINDSENGTGETFKSYNINCNNCSLIIQVENDMTEDNDSPTII